MKTIHTTIVQGPKYRPINILLNRPPPDIDKKEETLPHSTRRKLSQLMTNKSCKQVEVNTDTVPL